jgi:hypothetical protein
MFPMKLDIRIDQTVESGVTTLEGQQGLERVLADSLCLESTTGGSRPGTSRERSWGYPGCITEASSHYPHKVSKASCWLHVAASVLAY